MINCFFVGVATLMMPQFVLFAATAKLEALVLDDMTEEPIANVKLEGVLGLDAAAPQTPGAGYAVVNGTTDAKGRYKLSGRSAGPAGFFVKDVPSGYYWSDIADGRMFTNKNFLGVWQPDNLVVTLKLQRVVNPIPLFAKRLGTCAAGLRSRNVFSEETNKAAYDFLSGDWLPPMGTGVVADVVFTRLPKESFGEFKMPSGYMEEAFRHYMRATFIGEGNGLVEETVPPDAALKIRRAPEAGYKNEWLCWNGRDRAYKVDTNFDEKRCFSFRVRTKRNEKGEIVEAYYGKIYGGISFGHHSAKSGKIVPVAEPRFSYYLNPTSLDRNLEWNKVNLCKNPGELDDRQP